MEKAIEDKLNKILDNQDVLQDQVTAITTRLVGNVELKQLGLVDEVQRNSKVRKNVYRAGGFLTGLIAVWEVVRAKLGL